MKKKKTLYALGMLIFLSAALALFVIAADEQSVISSGLTTAEKIPLQDLITRLSGKNKHVELVDFYFGKHYVYATKMVQFREVYLPVFPSGQPESASNLQS